MRLVLGFCVVVIFAGCEKRNVEAVVLAKEHIAAAPNETPAGGEGLSKAAASPGPGGSAEDIRPIGEDEITVDGYVMKPEQRGTDRDPRAMRDEQWLVKVRTIDDGRTFNVATERSHYEKLKESDRVRVRYRVGKYTNTVWAAEIVERGK